MRIKINDLLLTERVLTKLTCDMDWSVVAGDGRFHESDFEVRH